VLKIQFSIEVKCITRRTFSAQFVEQPDLSRYPLFKQFGYRVGLAIICGRCKNIPEKCQFCEQSFFVFEGDADSD